MAWQRMRIPGAGQGESLPGDRGRYLLWLEPPVVDGEGHYVHFSWKASSFCIRDYLRQVERRQGGGLSALDVWRLASDRIPAKGELFVPVENFEFWTTRLAEMTENRKRGKKTSLWSRLSSRFSADLEEGGLVDESDGQKSASAPQRLDDSQPGSDGSSPYQRFILAWRKGAGFEIIEGTVGCSARYRGEPLLWVYPTYFQVAPEGKGNAHSYEVRALRDRCFPEIATKGTIPFDSEYFTWDRFESFFTAVRRTMKDRKN